MHAYITDFEMVSQLFAVIGNCYARMIALRNMSPTERQFLASWHTRRRLSQCVWLVAWAPAPHPQTGEGGPALWGAQNTAGPAREQLEEIRDIPAVGPMREAVGAARATKPCKPPLEGATSNGEDPRQLGFLHGYPHVHSSSPPTRRAVSPQCCLLPALGCTAARTPRPVPLPNRPDSLTEAARVPAISHLWDETLSALLISGNGSEIRDWG